MTESVRFLRTAVMLIMTAVFLMSASFAAVLPSGLSVSELEAEAQKLIKSHLDNDVPGLAMAVVQDGQIVFLDGYGYADMKQQIMIDPKKTIFEYGSINKLFVWVNAMQLKERGQLSLELPVDMYLPEDFKDQLNEWEPFTMLDLMNHMAGFEDPFYFFAETDRGKLIPLEEALLSFQPEQVFEPGQVVAYSNYGTSLAAYIIKSITGKNYHEFLEQHIFMPAGMQQAAARGIFLSPEKYNQYKAIGYTAVSSGFEEAPWVYVPKYPSGAAQGTVLDLARFALALMPAEGSESALFDSPDFHRRLFDQTYSPEDDFLGVAHGFWEYDGQVRSLAHGGTTAGFSGLFSVSPETGTGLVVLTNVAEERELLYALHKLVFGNITSQDIHTNISKGNAFDVEGMYVPARSSFNNFLEIVTYLSAYKIEAVNDKEFILHMPGYEARYLQVGLDHYRIYDSSSAMITFLYTELLFSEDDAGFLKATAGNTADLLEISTFRSLWYINASVIAFLAITILSAMMMILMSVKRDYLGIILSATIFIMMINNYLLLYRGLQILFFNPSGLQIHIWFNWMLLTLILLFLGYVLLNKDKQQQRFSGLYLQKQHSGLLLLMTIFIYLLYDWNFFNFF